MNIKSYIFDYPFINEEVLGLQGKLNELIKIKHASYCTLQAVPLTGMPGSHNVSDSVYSTVQILTDRYDHEINYYTKKINDLINEKILFDKVWLNDSILSFKERTIIKLRCFDGEKWRDVAKVMHYTKEQCQRLLNKAIEKMQCEVDKHA